MARASTLSWFYGGMGGNFDYWPERIDGPMLSEPSPFGNVALCADTDRTYHRVGFIGNSNGELPGMSVSATIQPDGEGNWTILETGEVHATCPSHTIRFFHTLEGRGSRQRVDSRKSNSRSHYGIFIADLRHRGFDFTVPSDPPSDTAWILLPQRTYPAATPGD